MTQDRGLILCRHFPASTHIKEQFIFIFRLSRRSHCAVIIFINSPTSLALCLWNYFQSEVACVLLNLIYLFPAERHYEANILCETRIFKNTYLYVTMATTTPFPFTPLAKVNIKQINKDFRVEWEKLNVPSSVTRNCSSVISAAFQLYGLLYNNMATGGFRNCKIHLLKRVEYNIASKMGMAKSIFDNEIGIGRQRPTRHRAVSQ